MWQRIYKHPNSCWVYCSTFSWLFYFENQWSTFFLQSHFQVFSALLMILWYLMHWRASLLVNLLPAAVSCMSSNAVMESLVIFLVENLSTKNIIRKQMLDNFYIILHQSNFYHAFKAFYPRIHLLKQIFHATEDLDAFPVPEFSTDFSPYSGCPAKVSESVAVNIRVLPALSDIRSLWLEVSCQFSRYLFLWKSLQIFVFLYSLISIPNLM